MSDTTPKVHLLIRKYFRPNNVSQRRDEAIFGTNLRTSPQICQAEQQRCSWPSLSGGLQSRKKMFAKLSGAARTNTVSESVSHATVSASYFTLL